MAVPGNSPAVINLQQIQAAAAACEPANQEQLAWRLWRSGVPCRPISLPPQWWQQPTDIEGGVWIAADQQEPPQWWLVQQRAGRVQLRAVQEQRGAAPAPDCLQLSALSLWPVLALGNSQTWTALARYLQLGATIRRVLPAALLRAGVWLLLPALLAAVLLGQLTPGPALLIALLSLLLGLVLDNQWHRLWLNRSDRQR
ncbi:MAG: hypothetical protein ACO289_12185, partial [Prochlorococcaceae cyanobacterium]